ncbi:MAG: WGR domain-containing protein [Myxococcota bacterium]
MSEWKVHLEFEEGNSSKFWRARVEGSSLYVNYGRIGSDGQTQVKQFGSADAAEKELTKLEREKRKKGYEDSGGGGGGGGGGGDDEEPEEDEDEGGDDEEEAKAPPPKPAAARPVGAAAITARAAQGSRVEHADFALDADGRHIDLRLSLDGTSVRTIVVERYASAEEAAEAMKRLKEQMSADGYQKVPARDTL